MSAATKLSIAFENQCGGTTTVEIKLDDQTTISQIVMLLTAYLDPDATPKSIEYKQDDTKEKTE